VGEAIACPEDNAIYEESSPAPEHELVPIEKTILDATFIKILNKSFTENM
jgi:hypothetical protein